MEIMNTSSVDKIVIWWQNKVLLKIRIYRRLVNTISECSPLAWQKQNCVILAIGVYFFLPKAILDKMLFMTLHYKLHAF